MDDAIDKKRQKRIAIIKALLEKTVENGCTEAEAMTAAAKAADMMSEHAISMDDVKRVDASKSNEDFHQSSHEFTPVDLVFVRINPVATAIAELTDTRCWRDLNSDEKHLLQFFGFSADVEIADYLLAICVRAMKDEVRKFAAEIQRARLLKPILIRHRSGIFVDGMRDRIAKRIEELDWKRKKSAGTELVVSKEKVVSDALTRTGVKLTTTPGKASKWGAGDDYFADVAAGDKVGFRHGIDGEEAMPGLNSS